MAYTTAAKVRAVLPTLLMDDDDLGVLDSGTLLTLSRPALDVPTVLKNSTSLTKAGADYTFVRPRKITLAAAATGENFIAQGYYGISDTAIESIIAQSDRFIDDYFHEYGTPGSTYTDDWSAYLSASTYLRSYATATEENLRRAEELRKIVLEGMENYRHNTFESLKTESSYTESWVRKVNG